MASDYGSAVHSADLHITTGHITGSIAFHGGNSLPLIGPFLRSFLGEKRIPNISSDNSFREVASDRFFPFLPCYMHGFAL